MPKHKPIKFETTLEPSIKKQIKQIMKENKHAKTVLNVTLALIAVGGILTLGTMAPGVFAEFTRMLQRRKKNQYEQYRDIWKNFNKLKQKGNLEFVEEKDGYSVYRLTEKGKAKIRKFILEELSIITPKNWDGKWRLIIFDIPEKYKKARMALYNKLKDLDFYQCQKSVWIHPFPCTEEIEFLKDVFNIKPYVKIFLVEEMTDGKTLYYFRNLIKKVIIK